MTLRHPDRRAATSPAAGSGRLGRSGRIGGWWAADEGRVTAFVVTLMTAVLVLAGLALDGGLALAAKIEANGRAESAARAGAQAIDLDTYRVEGRLALDPDRAVAAAHDYLAAAGASGTVTVTGDAVSVTVTTTHRTQLLGLAGITTLTVHGTGRAVPRRGVLTIEP